MSTLKRRIEYLLENKGVTPYKVSKDIGISQSVFTVIKNDDMDEKTLQNETATKIAKYFQVDKDWLLTGEGDMLIGDTSITNNGTSQQVAQNVRGHVTQSVTSDLTSTITELTDIIKQSQELASKEQSQTTALIQQLANSQQQISELIQLLKEK